MALKRDFLLIGSATRTAKGSMNREKFGKTSLLVE